MIVVYIHIEFALRKFLIFRGSQFACVKYKMGFTIRLFFMSFQNENFQVVMKLRHVFPNEPTNYIKILHCAKWMVQTK